MYDVIFARTQSVLGDLLKGKIGTVVSVKVYECFCGKRSVSYCLRSLPSTVTEHTQHDNRTHPFPSLRPPRRR